MKTQVWHHIELLLTSFGNHLIQIIIGGEIIVKGLGESLSIFSVILKWFRKHKQVPTRKHMNKDAKITVLKKAYKKEEKRHEKKYKQENDLHEKRHRKEENEALHVAVGGAPKGVTPKGGDCLKKTTKKKSNSSPRVGSRSKVKSK